MTTDHIRQCLVIDIETKPDDAYLTHPDVVDDIEAAIKVPENYTKPESILEYRKNAARKAVSKASLDPQLGRIVAIGFADLSCDEAIDCLGGDDEKAVLEAFRDRLLDFGPSIIAGWNVRAFDIPFITARCVVHGIELASWWPHSRSYHVIADAMELLAPERGAKLRSWLRRTGLPQKTADGSEVATMTAEEVIAYCTNDVRVERELLRRCAWAFPQLRNIMTKAAF